MPQICQTGCSLKDNKPGTSVTGLKIKFDFPVIESDSDITVLPGTAGIG